jgi:two-component system, OmpR family, response regulator
MSARILIVDGDEVARISMERALAQEGYTVRGQADGADAKQVLEEFRPDLAILEAKLGAVLDGYDLAQVLRSLTSLPIMFVSCAAEVADRLAGFAAGGDDYVAKPFAMAELLARAQALLARSRPSPVVCQVDDLVIDHAARKVTRAGSQVHLSPIQYQLLSTLAAHAHQVVTTGQLLSEVWAGRRVESNAMAVHMSSLRRKLEANGPRLIHTLRGVGYRLGA